VRRERVEPNRQTDRELILSFEKREMRDKQNLETGTLQTSRFLQSDKRSNNNPLDHVRLTASKTFL
jgi:hypothetical protein